jgi:hypothetical protein
MRFLPSILLTALAAAQTANLPTPLTPDLDALAKRVDQAHHPKGPTPEVTAFTGELELFAAGEEHGVTVGLAVKYLQSRDDKDKVRHLIRYQVRDAGKPIERGRDAFGFWHLVQGEPRDLTEQDAEDRAACQRHTNLARQLVRFLEPGTVLRQLTNPSPVREEEFKLGREAQAAKCLTVEGGLAAFPLLQRGGEDAPVLVKVYVDKADDRLLAIKAWPLAAGVRNEAGLEIVRLLELHERDGLLVPRKLEHLFLNAEGKLQLQSRATITKLSLRPDLKVESFDRTK